MNFLVVLFVLLTDIFNQTLVNLQTANSVPTLNQTTIVFLTSDLMVSLSSMYNTGYNLNRYWLTNNIRIISLSNYNQTQADFTRSSLLFNSSRVVQLTSNVSYTCLENITFNSSQELACPQSVSYRSVLHVVSPTNWNLSDCVLQVTYSSNVTCLNNISIVQLSASLGAEKFVFQTFNGTYPPYTFDDAETLASQLQTLQNGTSGHLMLIGTFVPIMGSILKQLQLTEYIVGLQGSARDLLNYELVRLFQRNSINNPNFTCNTNNSESSFSSNLETLTFNAYTKVASSAVPAVIGLRLLLESPNSIEWTSSCIYTNFLATKTQWEIADAVNFFGYQGTPFTSVAYLSRATANIDLYFYLLHAVIPLNVLVAQVPDTFNSTSDIEQYFTSILPIRNGVYSTIIADIMADLAESQIVSLMNMLFDMGLFEIITKYYNWIFPLLAAPKTLVEDYLFCPANFVVIISAHDSYNLQPQENALWQLIYALTNISPNTENGTIYLNNALVPFNPTTNLYFRSNSSFLSSGSWFVTSSWFPDYLLNWEEFHIPYLYIVTNYLNLSYVNSPFFQTSDQLRVNIFQWEQPSNSTSSSSITTIQTTVKTTTKTTTKATTRATTATYPTGLCNSSRTVRSKCTDIFNTGVLSPVSTYLGTLNGLRVFDVVVIVTSFL